MERKIEHSQDHSIELTEDDLESVAGGVALSLGGATGVAFGKNFSATVNDTKTQAISTPGFNLSAGSSTSGSIAG